MNTPPSAAAAAVHLCWCGKPYADGWQARQQHQDMYRHRPEPAKQRPAPDATGILTIDCRSGHHALCALDGEPGGVLVSPRVTAPCGCRCHQGGTGDLSFSCMRNAHAKCGGTRNEDHHRRACGCRCHIEKAGA